MTENYSAGTAKIRALRTAMVSLLDGDRGERVPLSKVQEAAGFLTEAYQGMLNEGTLQLISESHERFLDIIPWVESIYTDWKAIDTAFQNSLALAYTGAGPKQNLLLDSIHGDMRQWVGEPVSALYTRLHSLWTDHLEAYPWDAFLIHNTTHADTDDMNATLKTLVHGDHLDVEDAVGQLTGPLRHIFAHYLECDEESVDLLEESLWMRPEIVVMNDFWRENTQVRLLDVLRRKTSSKLSGSFAKIQDLLSSTEPNGDPIPPERVVEDVMNMRSDDQETYYRCLMLHPDQGVRRFAATHVDLEGFWKVATPGAVPMAAILSMLEKVVGSQQYDESFQKIFFNTIYRRLLMLTSRTDVLYTRGIVRIFTQVPFFMEDSYFDKLILLMDYLTAKEKFYQIRDSFLMQHVNKLRDEKDTVGTLEAPAPNFQSIPPVVLRKLARDGHYWYELAMHPMVKIARETIPHIGSQDRATKIANNRVVNSEVLRVIGKRRALFSTLSARLALLSNPRTPPMVSMEYLSDLSRVDVETLLRRSSVHPEFRQLLRKRLSR